MPHFPFIAVTGCNTAVNYQLKNNFTFSNAGTLNGAADKSCA